MAATASVVRNPSASRFEIEGVGDLGVLNYREVGNHITLVHTEVDSSLEGKGYGGLLARAALDYARGAGLRVLVTCPFVQTYVARHPEYKDLLQ